jgi:hypothetical protein
MCSTEKVTFAFAALNFWGPLYSRLQDPRSQPFLQYQELQSFSPQLAAIPWHEDVERLKIADSQSNSCRHLLETQKPPQQHDTWQHDESS